MLIAPRRIALSCIERSYADTALANYRRTGVPEGDGKLIRKRTAKWPFIERPLHFDLF
jgi:hypothetical protein